MTFYMRSKNLNVKTFYHYCTFEAFLTQFNLLLQKFMFISLNKKRKIKGWRCSFDTFQHTAKLQWEKERDYFIIYVFVILFK